jgi:hypothetical protein
MECAFTRECDISTELSPGGDANSVQVTQQGYVVTFGQDVSMCTAVASGGYSGPQIGADEKIRDGSLVVTASGGEAAAEIVIEMFDDGVRVEPATNALVNDLAVGELATSVQLHVAC